MHQMAFKSSLIPSLTMQRARALFIKDLASYSILLLSLTCFCPLFFTSPSTSSFIFFSIAIIFHSLYTLTLLSFFAPLPDFFHPYLCFNLLIHCVPFVSQIDVFAIGDPNQSTILAVSIAGGIVLLIFLVTCFIVSGR